MAFSLCFPPRLLLSPPALWFISSSLNSQSFDTTIAPFSVSLSARNSLFPLGAPWAFCALESHFATTLYYRGPCFRRIIFPSSSCLSVLFSPVVVCLPPPRCLQISEWHPTFCCMMMPHFFIFIENLINTFRWVCSPFVISELLELSLFFSKARIFAGFSF